MTRPIQSRLILLLALTAAGDIVPTWLPRAAVRGQSVTEPAGPVPHGQDRRPTRRGRRRRRPER